MASETFQAGQRVKWLHQPRGGYGYIVPVPAVVVRVGPKRVTIDADLAAGGTRRVAVKAAHLTPAKEQR